MKNALLVVIVSAMTLLAGEGLLRLVLSPSRLYSDLLAPLEWRAWRNQVKFWELQSSREQSGFPGYDPELGWDNGKTASRYRQHDLVSDNRPPEQTIVAIGDSFTFGLDVGPKETYPYYLDILLPDARVLNMGVAGYGIDQAYLKFMRFGLPLAPDVVVFGIYVGDYERTSLDFTTYAKPRFVATADGRWELKNQPVPAPDVLLRQTEQALDGRWYLLELLGNAWRNLAGRAVGYGDYFDATDALITHLLSALRDALAGRAQLLIVHIPHAKAFIGHNAERDEMSQRLLAIYDALDLQVIDLGKEFPAQSSRQEAFESYYVHFDDGSVGHLSAEGNRIVAELIVAALD